MNRLLARQLRRLGLDAQDQPSDLGAWQLLLERVSTVYDENDRSRYLRERAAEISSREMRELYEEVQTLSAQQVARSEQHYHNLFEQNPVATIEMNFTAAHAWFDSLGDAATEALTTDEAMLSHAIGLIDIVNCNQAAADLWRVPREELPGPVNPRSPINTSAREVWRRQLLNLIAGLNTLRFEFEGRRLDREPYAAMCQWIAPVINGTTDYSRVLVVMIDITDRRAAEERMRELVTSKDEFLAAVSHELRTPLTSVLGYADLLSTESTDQEDKAAMVRTIVEEAADLANLVEDLLVGARADLGQLSVNSQNLDLASEAAQVLASMRDSKVAAIEGADRVPARGDASRVRQILRNLLTNVQRYGGPNGVIRLAIDDQARVAVCDNGPPLAENTADKIFDRYYRDRVDPAQPGSVGIGLTISRDLARLMGGDLVYRRESGWNVFEVSLPLPDSDHAPAAASNELTVEAP